MGILILLIKQGLPFNEKNQLCIIYMYKTDILLLLKKEIQLISCSKHFNETNKIKQNAQKRHEPLTSLYKVKIMQRSVCLCIKHIPLQDHTSVPAPPPPSPPPPHCWKGHANGHTRLAPLPHLCAPNQPHYTVGWPPCKTLDLPLLTFMTFPSSPSWPPPPHLHDHSLLTFMTFPSSPSPPHLHNHSLLTFMTIPSSSSWPFPPHLHDLPFLTFPSSSSQPFPPHFHDHSLLIFMTSPSSSSWPSPPHLHDPPSSSSWPSPPHLHDLPLLTFTTFLSSPSWKWACMRCAPRAARRWPSTWPGRWQAQTGQLPHNSQMLVSAAPPSSWSPWLSGYPWSARCGPGPRGQTLGGRLEGVVAGSQVEGHGFLGLEVVVRGLAWVALDAPVRSLRTGRIDTWVAVVHVPSAFVFLDGSGTS